MGRKPEKNDPVDYTIPQELRSTTDAIMKDLRIRQTQETGTTSKEIFQRLINFYDQNLAKLADEAMTRLHYKHEKGFPIAPELDKQMLQESQPVEQLPAMPVESRPKKKRTRSHPVEEQLMEELGETFPQTPIDSIMRDIRRGTPLPGKFVGGKK